MRRNSGISNTIKGEPPQSPPVRVKDYALGFLTHRFVEAPRVADAKKRALELVREDLADRVRNGPRDLPDIDTEEVVEVERKEKQPGFIWYQPD